MKTQLEQIKAAAAAALHGAQDLKQVDALRVQYLGKKGELTGILKQMGKLSAEERPVMGQLANEVRAQIEADIARRQNELAAAAMEAQLKAETIDVTMPGSKPAMGKAHPLTTVLDEVKEIFLGMGFELGAGPEVELDYYNFEALNIPKDHPARDTQDTFYISTLSLM